MQNKQLAKILRNRPEKYPHELEKRYGRVLNSIMEVWGGPEAESYFYRLLVDERGGRTGFPAKVAEEIFFLNELHALLFHSSGATTTPLGETERIAKADARSKEFRAALEARGIEFVPPEFFRCVSGGDMSAVVLFINAGMGLESRNEQGWTPLMVALFEGREDIALFLIKKGANINFSDRSGYRPIHWAAYKGYSTVIREIALRGADVNTTTHFGWPPLLQAAARGHANAVETLIELGAQVNAHDNEGWTALHKACSNDDRTVVQALLTHGAKVNAAYRDGTTALHLATRLGHKVLVAMLLKAGANPNVSDNNGTTPLHLAARHRDITVISLLLESKAAVSPQDQHGATPLMHAVEAGAMGVIKLLIGAGARIEETLAVHDAERENDNTDRPQLSRVLSTAANLIRTSDRLMRRGSYRLHQFVANSDIAAVQREIANGADVNAVGPNGMTPLQIAASLGNIALWGLLVEHRASQAK